MTYNIIAKKVVCPLCDGIGEQRIYNLTLNYVKNNPECKVKEYVFKCQLCQGVSFLDIGEYQKMTLERDSTGKVNKITHNKKTFKKGLTTDEDMLQ